MNSYIDGFHTRASGPGGARSRSWRRRGRVAGIAAAGLCAAAASLPAAALAAARPAVYTGGARAVSYGSATLTGSVNPNGNNTSYYFQYGPTRLYGGQTAIADAGAGTHSVIVSLPISGLQPLTTYHYRLVAVNGAGATPGGDRTLLTSKVPLSLAILASPNPVLYGASFTVQGTLSGTANGNRVVVLQADPFGALGFQNLGNPELTTATGSFSFPGIVLPSTTQLRVVTTTNPPVISPVTVENVAVRVISHVRRTRRHGYARIYGTVTPAEDGMQVGILRIVHGRGVLVGGTILLHHSAASSSFSRIVRVRAGIYRVLVRVTSGAQSSNYGQPLLIG
jgi:hypothetical protein